jgi:hypothetical protein
MSPNSSSALFVALAAVLANRGAAQFEVGRVVGHDQSGGYASADIDGEIAAVGQPSAGSTANPGATYVFVRSGGNWIEEAKLLPSDPVIGGEFGSAVAVDGNRVFVGAPRNNGNVAGSGAVYLFRRTGAFPFASWSQQAKLTASDGVFDQYFGWALSVSGGTVAIGTNPNGGGPGAAYVFTGSAGNWSQEAKIAPPPNTFGQFGASVAVSGDTLLVGDLAPAAAPYGKACVFDRTGAAWSFTTELLAQSPTDPLFAYAVALDGDTALVGSPYFSNSTSVVHSGAVCSYTRQGGLWSAAMQIESATPHDNSNFGASLALEGDTAAVGDTLPSGASVLHVIQALASGGTEIGQLHANDPQPSLNFGIGRGAAIGISGDLVIAGGVPSVIFSNVPPPPVTYCTSKLNSLGCTPAMSAQGDASATSASPFLLEAHSVLSNKFGLLFFGVSGRVAFPFQGGTLCVLPPIRRTITQDSGGTTGATDCSGVYSYDFNALVRSGTQPDLGAGVFVDCQYWSRDPASPSTTGLTNAVEFGIGF